ncbi:MAG: CapA family protein [Bacteroidota bacterium]
MFWLPVVVSFLITLSLSQHAGAGSVGEAQVDSSQPTVTLRFGGDVLLGGYYESATAGRPAYAFEGFTALSDADVAMVNFEHPVTRQGKKVPKPYNFRMSPEYLPALTAAGIDIVSLANNHIFDYGKEGLFDTISYLDSIGILHVGAGRDREEAYRPVVLNIRGQKIGFLAYYGGGESPGARRRSAGVARRELPLIRDQIDTLRRRDNVGFIVVNLHWGTEKALSPDASQRAFAHAVIDAGADAVIGHHPHVLQGIERYRNGVIAYSLGNLLFGGNSRDRYDTGILEIRLEPDGPRYRFMPVRIDAWRASLLGGADSARVVQSVRRLSRMFPATIFTN